MDCDPTPRWVQRAENYRRALRRLEEAVERSRADPTDEMVRILNEHVGRLRSLRERLEEEGAS